MNLLAVIMGLAANNPPPDANTVVIINIGIQQLRIPAYKLVSLLNEAVNSLEEWTKTGTGPLIVAYGMLKVPANFLYPLVPGMLSSLLGVSVTLPKKPRHTDLILFVLRALVDMLAPYLALGEWHVGVNPEGDIAEAHVDLAGHYRVYLWAPDVEANMAAAAQEAG